MLGRQMTQGHVFVSLCRITYLLQFLLKACDLCQLQEFYVSVSDDARMLAALKEQLPELEKIVKQM